MDARGDPTTLTAELAQEIARDIGRITGFNVLITDRRAVVIGCGDSERLGTVHEASYEVLRTRRPATHTERQARLMHGVRPGMSLPIMVGTEAVGTVCLTGAPDEVHRFGLVVQRQTEILLREAALLRSHLLYERAVDDLLRDMALYDPEVVDADAVEARMAELGLTPGVPRTAVLLDARATGAGGSPAVSRVSLLRTVREVFDGGQDLVGETAAGRYAVLCAASGGPDGLPERCARLAHLIAERHGLAVRIAVGEPGTGVPGMHDSCRDAAAALRIGVAVDRGATVLTVADLRIPQLVALAVRQERARYTTGVLGTLRDRDDWPALRDTLVAWVEGGLNLVRSAERLHVHRNTLLYRLNKIEQLSGRSPREPRSAIALYLACLADLLERAPR